MPAPRAPALEPGMGLAPSQARGVPLRAMGRRELPPVANSGVSVGGLGPGSSPLGLGFLV